VKTQLDELPEIIAPVEPIIEEHADPSEEALESTLPSTTTTATTEQTTIIQGADVQHFYPQLSLTFTTRQNDISIEEYELLTLTISEGHVLDQFYKELLERATTSPDDVKVVKSGLTRSFTIDNVTYQIKLNLDEKPVTATVDLTA